VARRLNKLGFKAAALEGGFDAWKARYPVEPAEVERAESR
jgi:rhodanese-related sulfurtransferase